MNYSSKIEKIRSIIVPVLTGYGATQIGLFGSVVRNQEKPESDVDILVEMPTKNIGMIKLMQIIFEIEAKLGKKIDLVFYKNLKPRLKEIILKEEVRIYE